MNKQAIMQTAWKIAKKAAVKFGGKAVQFISESLKMAWSKAKLKKKASVKKSTGNDEIKIINKQPAHNGLFRVWVRMLDDGYEFQAYFYINQDGSLSDNNGTFVSGSEPERHLYQAWLDHDLNKNSDLYKCRTKINSATIEDAREYEKESEQYLWCDSWLDLFSSTNHFGSKMVEELRDRLEMMIEANAAN